MALSDFIEKNKVVAIILDELRRKSVFGNLIRNENAGSLGRGESYIIPDLGDITIGDGYDGTDIDIQKVDDTGKTLTVTESPYFAFTYDKVDNAKAMKNVMANFTEKGGHGLAQKRDIFTAAKLAEEAAHKETSILGTIETPISITDSNVIDYFSELQETMDDADVPVEGRYAVVPSFIASALSRANITAASTTLEAARSTGFVRNFAGFDIYKSNNLQKKTTATLTYSTSFTADNVISLSVNGVAISAVTYGTSHAATATALLAAINGLTGVTATKDATGLIYTIEAGINACIVLSSVTGGTAVAAVITTATSPRKGVQPITGIRSAFLMANTLKDFEMWPQTEKLFAEMSKGIDVYGGKVITPNAIVRGVVSKG